ncbi:TlpA disulfide reductase family protein [Pedobacter sp. BMA]|uniref:TlpA disulfide reductase family protein n=1 Tax=Pedobacter sp. BMA TaxID=1663685 RepID=UPI00064A4E30|nr:TlpA disulfide reductase family protein [Pedobacter sp. BMA]KLT63958.1 hypothetical protein AB669_19750 [Pedobacter sp. BMA]
MKIKSLLLLCLVPALGFSQAFNYTLKGKIGSFSTPAKMLLTYTLPGKKMVVDSSLLNNGSFEFRGAVDMPVNATLIIKKNSTKILLNQVSEENMLQLYLEPGNIKITGDSVLSSAKISGGKINDDYASYIKGMTPITNEIKKVLKSFSIDRKISGDQATRQIDSLMLRYDRSHQKFISGHLNSIVSVYALESYIANNNNLSQASNLFDKLSTKVKENDRAVIFKKSLDSKQIAQNSVKPTHIGAAAPDFEQPDVSGNMVALRQFKGKYVLLDFWASWCKPCRAENPNLVAAYKRFKDKGLEILSVSLDGSAQKKAWINAIKADDLSWTQVSDLKAWENTAALMYGIKAIPENFLIDPKGKVIAKNLRGEELNTALKKLFN